MNASLLDIIGYGASGLVAVSMLMVSMVRLRIINLVGAIAFIVYGALLGAIPVVVMNTFIVVVNLWYLNRAWLLSRSNCAYQLVDAGRLQQAEAFARDHARDIERHAPHFLPDYLGLASVAHGQAWVALHNGVVRGLALWVPFDGPTAGMVFERAGLSALTEDIVAAHTEGKSAFLVLDYIKPRYRDLGLGTKLHQVLNGLSRCGIERIFVLCPLSQRRTRAYLRLQGFLPQGAEAGMVLLSRDIAPLTDAT